MKPINVKMTAKPLTYDIFSFAADDYGLPADRRLYRYLWPSALQELTFTAGRAIVSRPAVSYFARCLCLIFCFPALIFFLTFSRRLIIF